MSAGFAAGVGFAWRGWRLLAEPGLRRFVVGPVLINIAVFAFALARFGQLFQQLIERYCAGWPDWALWIAWLVFGTLAAITLFFTFSLVANVLASPFNGLLAEAVERHLRHPGQALEFSWKSLFAEAGRALYAALRKLLYFGWRALPLVILSFIPGLNLVAPLLWIVFGGWMLAIEYLDCPLGNHGQLFPVAVDRLRGERAMALGFGVSLSLLTMVPVLNFLAMPIGVAGATAMYCAHFAPRE
jgi:CysZ protein